MEGNEQLVADPGKTGPIQIIYLYILKFFLNEWMKWDVILITGLVGTKNVRRVNGFDDFIF